MNSEMRKDCQNQRSAMPCCKFTMPPTLVIFSTILIFFPEIDWQQRIADEAELGATVETGLVPSKRCEKLICEKRSREFARIPVEEYGTMGEQKANIIWVG